MDTRPAGEYAARHLQGTLNIPLNHSFVNWAGWLLPYSADLYFIVEDPSEEHARELVRQLALIGLDRVAGVFEATAVAHLAARGIQVATVPQLTVDDMAGHLAAHDAVILDVRNATEWASGHLPSALHIPLGYLSERLEDVPSDRPVVVHCQGGGRSAIAASLLHRAGRDNVSNMVGGFQAWMGAGLPVVAPGPL